MAAAASDNNNNKKGALFLGCCCDTRRAVIITSTIAVINTIIKFYMLLLLFGLTRNGTQPTESVSRGKVTAVLVMNAFSIVGCVISIGAAVQFSFVSMIIGYLFFIVGFIGEPISAIRMYTELGEDYDAMIINWTQIYVNIGINVALIVIYTSAHIMFTREVRNRTMSAATYDLQEKASCCCV